MERAESGVGALSDDLRAGIADEPPGQPGRPGQQRAPLLFARQADGLLEKLARDPEGEGALAQGTARFEHKHAGVERQRPAARHQAALADARGALDQKTRAGAVSHPLDRAAERLELRFALEQMGIEVVWLLMGRAKAGASLSGIGAAADGRLLS